MVGGWRGWVVCVFVYRTSSARNLMRPRPRFPGLQANWAQHLTPRFARKKNAQNAGLSPRRFLLKHIKLLHDDDKRDSKRRSQEHYKINNMAILRSASAPAACGECWPRIPPFPPSTPLYPIG